MVLRKLFGGNAPAPPWRPRAPEGQRLYAIGDIHGRRDLLDALLDQIEVDDAARGAVAETRLIFLGDLVDRGPESRGVVDRVRTLMAASRHVSCLKGNHEELMIRAWEGDRGTAGVFNRNGGRETLLSYGVDPLAYDEADLGGLVDLIGAHVPAEHIAFLDGLPDWIVAGDYLFVHAGIRPGSPIEKQKPGDLRWIRDQFTRHAGRFDHMVIHGHTITETPDAQPNRIGIDTGAYATGRLTALGLEGDAQWFLSTGTAA